jgi:hypothetical protein
MHKALRAPRQPPFPPWIVGGGPLAPSPKKLQSTDAADGLPRLGVLGNAGVNSLRGDSAEV